MRVLHRLSESVAALGVAAGAQPVELQLPCEHVEPVSTSNVFLQGIEFFAVEFNHLAT